MILTLLLLPLCFTSDFNLYSEQKEPEEQMEISADGDELDLIPSFSESIADEYALDADSDSNADFSNSEWDFNELGVTDDVGLDPDTDSNYDVAYSEWDFGETMGVDESWYPDPDTFYYSFDGSVTQNLALPQEEDVHEDTWIDDFSGTYAGTCHGAGGLCSGTDYVSTVLIYSFPKYVAETWSATWFMNVHAETTGTVSIEKTQVWDYETSSYDDLSTDIDSGSFQDISETISGSEYFDYSNGNYTMQVRLYCSDESTIACWIDYSYVELDVSNSTNGFAEGFAIADEWSMSANEGSETISTDGDYATFHAVGDTTDDLDYFYETSISLTSADWSFFEIRYKMDSTDADLVYVYLDMDTSIGGSDYYVFSLTESTSWKTMVFERESDHVTKYSSDGSIEMFVLVPRLDSGTLDIDVDYIRVGKKLGWSFDCSSEWGISNDGLENYTYTSSSDGDLLTLNITRDDSVAGNNYPKFYLEYDPTTTRGLDIEKDYYAFIEFNVSVTIANGARLYLEPIIEGGRQNPLYTFYSTAAWSVYRFNVYEIGSGGSEVNRIWFMGFMDALDESYEVEIDYVRVYALKNWTYDTYTGLDNPRESVAYYDSDEDALVMEADFSSSTDWWRLNIRNTSLEYQTSDMVMMFTVKADTNSSCRFRDYYYITGDTDAGISYYLCDQWQTIAVPLPDTSITFDYCSIYMWDWTDSESGDRKIYIKNNVTIRPSWYNETDSNVYGDSFADLSEWSDYGSTLEAGDTFTTDGDHLFLECGYQGSATTDIIKQTAISFATTDYWLEFNYKANATFAGTGARIYVWLRDSSNNRVQWYIDPTDTDWHKVIEFIPGMPQLDGSALVDIEEINILAYCPDSGDAVNFELDYLRIANRTYSGYQIDCSMVGEWEQSAGASIAESNGDTIKFSAANWDFDLTDMDVSQYEFLELSISSLTGGWQLYCWDGDNTQTAIQTTIYTTGVHRFNLEEILADHIFDWLRFYAVGGIAEVDYIKFYTFANWTYNGIAGLDTNSTTVGYYDSTEESIVIDVPDCSSISDYIDFRSRNTSIGYYATDMVMMVTLKAETNSTCRFRTYTTVSGVDDLDKSYNVYDDWQTIAIPFIEDSGTITNIRIFGYDWNTAYADDFKLYIKNNITLRPSWHDASTESGIYSESFANASEWVIHTIALVDPSTNGDNGQFDVTNGIGWNWWKTTGLTLSNASYYIEYRIKCNASSVGNIAVYVYDDAVQLYSSGNIPTLTTWVVKKAYFLGEPDRIYVVGSTSVDVRISVDYLRIAPITKLGYQDDCSTMNVIYSSGDYAYSDGDVLECVDSGDGGTYDFYLPYLDPDYYQFIEIQFSQGNSYFALNSIDENDALATITGYTTMGSTTLYRYNLDATENQKCKAIRLTSYSGNNLYVDYIKVYTIANWTITKGSLTTADVIYVDSGELKFVRSANSYFILDYDPTVSFSTATYTIWNLTLSDVGSDVAASYDWRPRFLVGGVLQDSSDDNDETRGGFETSGTCTDIYFVNYESMTLSAFTFIEDQNAPTITNFWITPYTPTEDDAISMAVYATDAIEVYSVIFNAIDYPSGFTDIDYEATESANQSDLWNYTFSSMIAGYYAWKVTVSDGVNTATDILVLQVVTNELSITDIILITTGTTQVQVSGKSNKDASYTIYEDAGSGDVDKGSGSVNSGWFSITWNKESTAGATVSIGIKFTSGTYTTWVNGSYSVASATVLFISDTLTTDTTSELQLSGYTNLACNYTVFSNDTENGFSGELTTGSFAITWTKETASGLHRWAVKFNDTSTTRWVNGSYDLTSTTFLVSSIVSSSTEIEVKVSAYANLACSYTVYSNDSVIDSGSLSAGSIEVSWAKSSTIGTHSWGIKFVSGSVTRWINGSYYISITYAWSTIYTYDEGGDYVDWEQFTYLINGTQIYGHEFYDRTDGIYLITVQDVFGATIYSSFHNWTRTLQIILSVHTFKVYNMLDDQFIFFELSSSAGGTWSQHIGPCESVTYELYRSALYNYEYTTFDTDTRLHDGSLSITQDTGLVIEDIGLDRILLSLNTMPTGGGGGLSTEDFDDAMEDLTALLGILWSFTWGFGLFLIFLMWIVPFIKNRREKNQKEDYDDSGTTQSSSKGGYSSSKKSQERLEEMSGGYVYPSTADMVESERKRHGLGKSSKKGTYGPRQ